MTIRLLSYADVHWDEFDGHFALQLKDPLDLPPRRFLSAIYAFWTRDVSHEGKERLNEWLNSPLPWESLDDMDEGAWSEEAMGASFLAAQQAVG